MNSFESLVALNLIDGIGSVRLERLLSFFGKPENVFLAPRDKLTAVSGITAQLAENICTFKPHALEKELGLAKKKNIEIITCLDREYPGNLKETRGFPIVLYVKGEILEKDQFALAIVGSRRASFYGLENAENFAAQLSAAGFTIVSGMARGIDTASHKGALKAGGRTIAVIGSGFNHIYPPENIGLSDKIAASGAVISEFPMDTKPLSINFPRRNRLISGLSKGVLVAEAAVNSGAIITADFALEQSREVFAIPGRIGSENSSGVNFLIQEGAKLVTGIQDILEEFGLSGPLKNETKKDRKLSYSGSVNQEENSLFDLIGDEPVTLDELLGNARLNLDRIFPLLLNLRLKKLIRELPGKQFVRVEER